MTFPADGDGEFLLFSVMLGMIVETDGYTAVLLKSCSLVFAARAAAIVAYSCLQNTNKCLGPRGGFLINTFNNPA